jgi:hypothetical protein
MTNTIFIRLDFLQDDYENITVKAIQSDNVPHLIGLWLIGKAEMNELRGTLRDVLSLPGTTIICETFNADTKKKREQWKAFKEAYKDRINVRPQGEKAIVVDEVIPYQENDYEHKKWFKFITGYQLANDFQFNLAFSKLVVEH